MNNYEHLVEQWMDRPTLKRDRPSESKRRTVRYATEAVRPLVEQGLRGMDLIRATDEMFRGRSDSYRKLICRDTLAPFYVFADLITLQERKEVLRMYRARRRTWSDKAFTQDEVDRIFLALKMGANDGFTGARAYFSGAVLYLTGIRAGQLASILYEETSVVDGLWSARMKRMKSHSEETIRKSIYLETALPTGDSFGDVLQLWESYRLPSSHLIHTRDGAPVSVQHVRNMFLAAGLVADVQIHPHRFRHTAGTMVANASGVLSTAKLLDHSSLTISQRYIRTDYKDESAEIILHLHGKKQ